jgi:Fe-S oxidoreductase
MDLFIIIPFIAGLAYLAVILVIRGVRWIGGLSRIDKLRLVQSLRTRRTLLSLKEAFMEGLLHRRIFRKNPVLGYMHMSLAFGWFLLIVVGHIESMTAGRSVFVPFYRAVFFRYFEYGKDFAFSGVFSFAMDLLLLFVLTGLGLAMLKRFKKRLFGLKKTTRLKTADRIALTSLWLIFPLRLLAESFSAALHDNGSFLTSGLGRLFGHSGLAGHACLPLWIAYSLALGFFFTMLPNSRYMHIPAEILFIFLRNAGIQLKKRYNTYQDVQVFSCSRCGICLDDCQLTAAGIQNSQSVYLLKSIRNRSLSDEELFNCLLCGKCQLACPVGIGTNGLRISQRIESTLQYNSSYEYLEDLPPRKAATIYFAGCMSHLLPGTIQSMKAIFRAAGEDVWFMDEEKSPCCGRPLMLAGQYEAATKLIANNTLKITGSGAGKLIVSCPICYRVFREDYSLGKTEVLFHAEYILRLIQDGTLRLQKGPERMVYHDPCELGRGMGIYEEPREVLRKAGNLVRMKHERESAHCCGGSLGNLKIRQAERSVMTGMAVDDYLSYRPDILATACPLCKKTFSRNRQVEVMDIAEVTVMAMGRAAEAESRAREHKRIPEEALL